MPLRVLVIPGTRPEAIKLAPLVLRLRELRPLWTTQVCATGQHSELLDDALALFGIRPEWHLHAMTSGQSLASVSGRILAGLGEVLAEARPGAVVVQGDTVTTLCGALAAFWAHVPVVHVEAGLRTGNPAEPFPEEMNRVLTTRLAALHCAATEGARRNLLAEGIPERDIVVTGNTGIDALYRILERRGPVVASPGKRLILVTAHRRESFGEPLERICGAIAQLSRRPGLRIVFPVHPNPQVRDVVHRILGPTAVELTTPLDYPGFAALLGQASLVISDSGGVQEEAPSLGVPVIVLRDRTERPEAVEAGAAILAGTDPRAILAAATLLLDNPAEWDRASAAGRNLFGDGRASERIIEAMEQRIVPQTKGAGLSSL